MDNGVSIVHRWVCPLSIDGCFHCPWMDVSIVHGWVCSLSMNGCVYCLWMGVSIVHEWVCPLSINGCVHCSLMDVFIVHEWMCPLSINGCVHCPWMGVSIVHGCGCDHCPWILSQLSTNVRWNVHECGVHIYIRLPTHRSSLATHCSEFEAQNFADLILINTLLRSTLIGTWQFPSTVLLWQSGARCKRINSDTIMTRRCVFHAVPMMFTWTAAKVVSLWSCIVNHAFSIHCLRAISPHFLRRDLALSTGHVVAPSSAISAAGGPRLASYGTHISPTRLGQFHTVIISSVFFTWSAACQWTSVMVEARSLNMLAIDNAGVNISSLIFANTRQNLFGVSDLRKRMRC